MRTEVQAAKAALRRQIREQLKALTGAQRAEASERARALLMAQARWLKARAVLFFAPLPEEVDVWPLLEEALQAGKGVFLPRFVERDEKPLKPLQDSPPPPHTLLKHGVNEKAPTGSGRYVICEVRQPDKDVCLGQFGIREPAGHCAESTIKRLDLVLVPGVAFDLHGRRLGRGKGYYDQLLAVVPGRTCGVAFDQQIVGEIPIEPHDIHLNCILTPTRWIEL